jgi:hypothetical protein
MTISVAEPSAGGVVIKLPVGAVITNYSSGSLLFYEGVEEIYRKVIVAEGKIR